MCVCERERCVCVCVCVYLCVCVCVCEREKQRGWEEEQEREREKEKKRERERVCVSVCERERERERERDSYEYMEILEKGIKCLHVLTHAQQYHGNYISIFICNNLHIFTCNNIMEILKRASKTHNDALMPCTHVLMNIWDAISWRLHVFICSKSTYTHVLICMWGGYD